MKRPIHDWTVGDVNEEDLRQVAVGPPATGAGDAIERAAVFWIGPGETSEEARAAALRAAKIAWRVTHALTGIGPAELPAELAHATSVQVDDENVLPGLSLLAPVTSRLMDGEGDWPPTRSHMSTTDVRLGVRALIRVAATRAKLSDNGCAMIAFGTDASAPDAFLKTTVAIESDGWTSHVHADGALLDAITGLAVANALCEGCWWQEEPDARLAIPESATLRAGLPKALRAGLVENLADATTFLEHIGLADVARDLAEDYA